MGAIPFTAENCYMALTVAEVSAVYYFYVNGTYHFTIETRCCDAFSKCSQQDNF